MEIKDLDLRPFNIPKKGKLKLYSKIREEKRIIFCCSTSKNSYGIYTEYLVKFWFNRLGGGQHFYKLSDLGNSLFSNLPDYLISIPEENFKLLI
jgi:hypothetical protein